MGSLRTILFILFAVLWAFALVVLLPVLTPLFLHIVSGSAQAAAAEETREGVSPSEGYILETSEVKDKHTAPPRIIIEVSVNENFRSYHVTRLLTSARELTYSKEEIDYDYYELDVVARVAGIEGVSEFLATPYQFDVVKGKAFCWKEVEPKILEVLRGLWEEEERASIVVISSGLDLLGSEVVVSESNPACLE